MKWRFAAYGVFLLLLAMVAIQRAHAPAQNSSRSYESRTSPADSPIIHAPKAATPESLPAEQHRASDPPAPISTASRRSEVAGSPRRPCVQAEDAPPEFMLAAGLTDEQASRFARWTTEWRAALTSLADEAVRQGLSTTEVSTRAQVIQAGFESRLRASFSDEQFSVYESYRRQGLVGTYAIQIPRDESP